MKRIYLPIEKKNEILAMKWNVNGVRRTVSFVTLQSALNFQTQSGLSNVLRAAAMQRGGVLYDNDSKPKQYVPKCCSSYDRNTGIWEFVFSGCVTLTVSENTATAELLTPDGTEIYEGIKTISQLMNLQWVAEQTAAKFTNQ